MILRNAGDTRGEMVSGIALSTAAGSIRDEVKSAEV